MYNGLCSCCKNDCSVCIKGCLCPVWLNSCTAYELAVGYPMKCCQCWCVPFVFTPFYNRKTINRHFGFQNSNCSDCFTVCCCYPCSVCQNQNNLNLLTADID